MPTRKIPQGAAVAVASTPTEKPPTLMEIMQAVSLAHQPAPVAAPSSDKDSLTRAIITGVSATIGLIIIGLLGWMATSVSTLNTNMGIVSVSLTTIQKSIADLQQSQGSAAQQLADGKAIDAKQDARIEAHEADMSRVKERIRLLEGQPPVNIGGSDRGR